MYKKNIDYIRNQESPHAASVDYVNNHVIDGINKGITKLFFLEKLQHHQIKCLLSERLVPKGGTNIRGEMKIPQT